MPVALVWFFLLQVQRENAVDLSAVLLLHSKTLLYKWKNHFFEVKGDIWMEDHEKVKNKGLQPHPCVIVFITMFNDLTDLVRFIPE